jgi:hypothetical protein
LNHKPGNSDQSVGIRLVDSAISPSTVTNMGSISITHWIIFTITILMFVSPILGIIRGTRNGAVAHALLSYFIPIYGLIYFFVARGPRVSG